MIRAMLDAIPVFLAVAKSKSFRRAAAALGVTTPAVSHRVRRLEAALGVVLFARTTRSVTLTEAGQTLLEQCSPHVAALEHALALASERSKEPTGLLRLSVPRIAVPLVLMPVLPELRRRFPKVRVEVHVDDALRDLGEHGYDAGIRLGSMVQRDMVSTPLTEPFRTVIVGSPEYFERKGRPRSLEELREHEIIGYRNITGGDVYRWELQKRGSDVALDLDATVVLNDAAMMVDAAAAGMGLAYSFDAMVVGHEREGRLERVLDSFAITEPGLHLYFAPRAETAPKLRALIDTAREVLRPKKRGRHR